MGGLGTKGDIMYNFEYVPASEWKPVKAELIRIIQRLQNEVRNDFTFQYHFVGSSQRNMITRDPKSNIGFDFDVNIEVNDPDENYSPAEIRNILRKGLDRVTNPDGVPLFRYDYTEDSTRVLTIKVKDKASSRIKHSCDFCIINNCHDGKQQYIRYNKRQNYYSWEYQPKGFYQLPEKIDFCKRNQLWQEVRNCYLDKKSSNCDKHKKSRSIFAETIHQICQQNGYYK